VDDAFSVLLDRARRGDRDAVDALLEPHLAGIQAYLRLRAGPVVRARESACDLAQSVCREAIEKIGKFEKGGEDGFRHWLYALAWRKLADRADYYKAEKRDAAREAPAPEGSASSDDRDVIGVYATLATPSRVLAAREEIARFEKAFDRLPDEYREVILLANVVGLSRAEIARQMNRTEIAVRTALARALARLASLVDGEEEDAGGNRPRDER